MNPMIDLYLISGFLGAGKTTFLQKMMENFQDKKVGVIVNEFGKIGIDGKIIEREGIQLVEINNGSIFCSCLKGSFIKTLIEFSKQEIDVLIVENSGMADPSNMHMLLDELKDKTGRPYHYRGSVCMIDPVSFMKHVRILSPVQNQVATSNLIIINKMDLVNMKTIDDIKKKIYEINPEAFIFQTIYGDVPDDILEKNLLDNGYVGETTNNCWNRPAVYAIESEENIKIEKLELFISRLHDYVLRMKGFVKGCDGWWQVDVVEDWVQISKINLDKRDIIEITKLVLIGRDETDFSLNVKSIWNDIFECEMTLYE